MKKTFVVGVLLLAALSVQADISVTDRDGTARRMRFQQRHAENLAKRDAKRAAARGTAQRGMSSEGIAADSTGSISLTDAAGMQYFINTDITFVTTSSASGALSEASFTGPVVASTSAGGTTTSTLNDAFDGYHTLCVSFTNAGGPCVTGDPTNYAFYNNNGPAAFDTTVPATAECTSRQVAFPSQTIGALSVSRKVFVPTNDEYVRWVDSFTNTSGAPVTFNAIIANNLGSDSNTRITGSSSGDTAATLADSWVASFQNFSGSTSSDPRLGHVFQGTGVVANPLTIINFVDGDDNPYWGYAITLAAGETKSIANYATGQATRAAAADQAAALAAYPASAQQCLSSTEIDQIANFAAPIVVLEANLSITKSASAPTVASGAPFSYTLNVSNAGPDAAANVSVTDVLPAGTTFVSASGSGWSCGFAAGTVTCTMPTLAVSAAAPITINLIAPNAPGPLVNSATVSSDTPDSTPANNTSNTVTVTVAAAEPVAAIPTLNTWMLLMLTAALGFVALRRFS